MDMTENEQIIAGLTPLECSGHVTVEEISGFFGRVQPSGHVIVVGMFGCCGRPKPGDRVAVIGDSWLLWS